MGYLVNIRETESRIWWLSGLDNGENEELFFQWAPTLFYMSSIKEMDGSNSILLGMYLISLNSNLLRWQILCYMYLP